MAKAKKRAVTVVTPGAKTGAGKAGAGASVGHSRIATNRRARRDYDVLDTFEAGIELRGAEVKSLRAGLASLREAWAAPRKGQLWLLGLHIGAYPQAGGAAPEPLRDRRLLLHRAEIVRLASRVAEQGLTLVPLALYWKRGRAKVELGLCRGRRSYDKRQAIRAREEKRDVARAMRHKLRSVR